MRCISIGFFADEDQAGHLARTDAAQGARAVPHRRLLGRPRLSSLVDLPPGTGDVSISLAQFLPQAEMYVVTTPQPAAQRVAQRAGFMAQKVQSQGQGVIENMSWFTGDDGQRYELFGRGGGRDSPKPSRCRCSANCRWYPRCVKVATTATPSSSPTRTASFSDVRAHRGADRHRARPHAPQPPRTQVDLVHGSTAPSRSVRVAKNLFAAHAAGGGCLNISAPRDGPPSATGFANRTFAPRTPGPMALQKGWNGRPRRIEHRGTAA